jgi:hypothetical protein
MTSVPTRPSRLLPLVASVLVLAAALVTAMQAPAAARHADCDLTVDAPSLTYGIYAFATTSVDCASVKNNIRIHAELLRDGVVVDEVVEHAHKRADWGAYLLDNDDAGDQEWCLRVTTRINPHTIGPVTRCGVF